MREWRADYLGYRYCRSCWAPHCASSGGRPCRLPAGTSHTPGRAPCLRDRPGGSADGLGWQKKHCRSEGRKEHGMRQKHTPDSPPRTPRGRHTVSSHHAGSFQMLWHLLPRMPSGRLLLHPSWNDWFSRATYLRTPAGHSRLSSVSLYEMKN